MRVGALTKRKVYHPITQILYNEFGQKNCTGGKER